MIRWVTLFLDRPANDFESVVAFWAATTGTTPSETRGADDEFLTLKPADGDAFIRMQRVRSDGGSHLDLHVDNVRAAADTWIELGATEIADLDDVVVLRSPGGLHFCAVAHHGEAGRPRPIDHGDGQRTIVDQVCIDIAPDHFDGECEFWTAVTGWRPQLAGRPEFRVIQQPADQPLRFLLQRRGDGDRGATTECHVDFACDDVGAARRAHEAAGARHVKTFQWWTVMADPAEVAYCLTSRTPDASRRV